MTPQYRPGPLWRLVDKLLDVIEAYAYRAAGVQVTRRHAGLTCDARHISFGDGL